MPHRTRALPVRARPFSRRRLPLSSGVSLAGNSVPRDTPAIRPIVGRALITGAAKFDVNMTAHSQLLTLSDDCLFCHPGFFRYQIESWISGALRAVEVQRKTPSQDFGCWAQFTVPEAAGISSHRAMCVRSLNRRPAGTTVHELEPARRNWRGMSKEAPGDQESDASSEASRNVHRPRRRYICERLPRECRNAFGTKCRLGLRNCSEVRTSRTEHSRRRDHARRRRGLLTFAREKRPGARIGNYKRLRAPGFRNVALF